MNDPYTYIAGSITGRWSQMQGRAHRQSGKSIALGMAYHAANYAAIEKRLKGLTVPSDRNSRTMRMHRASDQNKARLLQFGQATMLGWTFSTETASWGLEGWYAIPPVTNDLHHMSLGPFTRKWEAVEAALRKMGVEQ